MQGFKTMNEYADLLSGAYDQMPKAVLAAIAVSFAIQIRGEDITAVIPESLIADLVSEWHVLNANGIVPQKVPAKLRAYDNFENFEA